MMPGQMGQMPAVPGAAKPMAEPEVIRNLMVNYIPTTIDEVQLRQLFEMYGPVESVKIVVDRETRTSKGYGFVKFRFSFSAVHAIQYLNGYPLMNKRLKVAYSNQAEAQKILSGQVPDASAGYPQHPYAHAAAAGNPAEIEAQQQLYMQQMYMQQLAALQMMQYQSMPHQHAHQHAQQQQQQQQQAQRGAPHMHHQQQPPMQQSPAQPQQPQAAEGQPQQ